MEFTFAILVHLVFIIQVQEVISVYQQNFVTLYYYLTADEWNSMFLMLVQSDFRGKHSLKTYKFEIKVVILEIITTSLT